MHGWREGRHSQVGGDGVPLTLLHRQHEVGDLGHQACPVLIVMTMLLCQLQATEKEMAGSECAGVTLGTCSPRLAVPKQGWCPSPLVPLRSPQRGTLLGQAHLFNGDEDMHRPSFTMESKSEVRHVRPGSAGGTGTPCVFLSPSPSLLDGPCSE